MKSINDDIDKRIDIGLCGKLAKANCSKCYGRGYIGIYKEIDSGAQTVQPCRCVINKFVSARKEELAKIMS